MVGYVTIREWALAAYSLRAIIPTKAFTMKMKFLLACAACVLNLATASAQLIINEICAKSTVNNYPREKPTLAADWVELYNTSALAVSGQGWQLSRLEGSKAKTYSLPAVQIPAKGYAVVYFVGKDGIMVSDPTKPMAMDTGLSAKNGAQTILLAYNGVEKDRLQIPESLGDDQTIGVAATGLVEQTLIGADTPYAYAVPQNGDWGATWREVGFDASAWTPGKGALGATGDQVTEVTGRKAFFTFNQLQYEDWKASAFPADDASGTLLKVKELGTIRCLTQETADIDGVSRTNVMDFSLNTSATAAAVLDSGTNYMSPKGAMTMSFWVKMPTQINNGGGGGVTLIGTRQKANNHNHGFVFSITSTGLRMEMWNGTGGRAVEEMSSIRINDARWHHLSLALERTTNSTRLAVYLDGKPELAHTSTLSTACQFVPNTPLYFGYCGTSSSYWNQPLKGMLDDVAIYDHYLTADEAMVLYSGKGPSAPVDPVPDYTTTVDLQPAENSVYTRTVVTQPAGAINYGKLGLAYQDAVRVWVNGAELFRSDSFGNNPAWDAAAESAHPVGSGDIQTVSPEFFTPGEPLVVAAQWARRSAAEAPLYGSLGLSVVTTNVADKAYAIFNQMTLGGENNPLEMIPFGVSFANASHTPAVPAPTDDITITVDSIAMNAKTPVTNATLYLRKMFETQLVSGQTTAKEKAYPMDKVGTIGLTTTWRVTVPAADLPPAGNLFRYRIVATDSNAKSWREPAFYDPLNGPEYHGSIVRSPVESELPVYHLFVSSDNLTNMDKQYDSIMGATPKGARCSLFYDGELYDNVRIDLRGNTSAAFRKKSHGLRFNKGHGLRHDASGVRVRKTSFTTEYLDASYLRQGLAFWFMRQVGIPAPFHYPVRIQLNGAFYQLGFHTNRMSDELIEGYGLDPNGTAYKSIATFVNANGGADTKKIMPEDGDNSLMKAAVDGLQKIETRATYFHDNFDVAAWVNYYAATRITQEMDDVWANMCVYYDTYGQQTWRPLPYDMNLSWGQFYKDGDWGNGLTGELATADRFKSHPFYGGEQVRAYNKKNNDMINNANAIFATMTDDPVIREMIRRRLRTLMDQFLQAPGTTKEQSILWQRMKAVHDTLLPTAKLDRDKWGHESSRPIWIWPTFVTPEDGIEKLWTGYIEPRRTHLFVTHAADNAANPYNPDKCFTYIEKEHKDDPGIFTSYNAGIPGSQTANLTLTLSYQAGTAANLKADEQVLITNPNDEAVDLSNWTLAGDITHTCQPGTVIPAKGTLYLTPDRATFKRLHSGKKLFVQGNYKGQIGTRANAITLTDTTGRLVNTLAITAQPSPAQQFLRVSEFMFDPPKGAHAIDEQLCEYIELINTSPTATLDLGGVTFTEGILYTFPAGISLAPSSRLILVKDSTAFAAWKPGVGPTYQWTSGSLSNAGERLRLLDAAGEKISDIEYKDGWYPTACGQGASLIARDPWQTLYYNFDKSEYWYPSPTANGALLPGTTVTPTTKPTAVAASPIYINEVLAHTDPPQCDTVELYNDSDVAVDISGWFLSDDPTKLTKYTFPDGSLIQPRGFLVIKERQMGFLISADGEPVILSSSKDGFPTGYTHQFDVPPTPNGVSVGRVITSAGKERFQLEKALTLGYPSTDMINGTPVGAPNAGPLIGPIVITAIHKTVDSTIEPPYIELTNITDTTQTLAKTHPTEPSRGTFPAKIQGDLAYTFPITAEVAAGERFLVVDFDPSDKKRKAAFMLRYNIANATQIFGPWQGLLLDEGDITLSIPDNPNAPDVDHVEPWVSQVPRDRAKYKNTLPWPTPTTAKPTLIRAVDTLAIGSEPTIWSVGTYAPGILGDYNPNPDAEEIPDVVLGESVSINFSSNSTSSKITTSTDAFGMNAVQGRLWNEHLKNGNTRVTLSSLQTSESTPSPITVTVYDSRGHYQTAGWDMTNLEARLHQGYLDDSPGDTGIRPKLIISNIPYPQYSLYLYCASDSKEIKFAPFVVNNIAYCGNPEMNATIQDDKSWGSTETNKSAITHQEGKNVLIIRGLTAATLNTRFMGRAGNRGTISAIQIVAEVNANRYTRKTTAIGPWHSADSWLQGSKTISWVDATADKPSHAVIATSLTVDAPVTLSSLTLKGKAPIAVTGTGALTFLPSDTIQRHIQLTDLEAPEATLACPIASSAPVTAVLRNDQVLDLQGETSADLTTHGGTLKLSTTATPPTLTLHDTALELNTDTVNSAITASDLTIKATQTSVIKALTTDALTTQPGELYLDTFKTKFLTLQDANLILNGPATLTHRLVGGSGKLTINTGATCTLDTPENDGSIYDKSNILARSEADTCTLSVFGTLDASTTTLTPAWLGTGTIDVAHGTLKANGIINQYGRVAITVTGGTLAIGSQGLDLLTTDAITLGAAATLQATADTFVAAPISGSIAGGATIDPAGHTLTIKQTIATQSPLTLGAGTTHLTMACPKFDALLNLGPATILKIDHADTLGRATLVCQDGAQLIGPATFANHDFEAGPFVVAELPGEARTIEHLTIIDPVTGDKHTDQAGLILFIRDGQLLLARPHAPGFQLYLQ